MVLKRNLLSMALASATLLVTANVQAQSAEEAKTREAASEKESEDAKSLDKVTVTGIRTGIENAIETKQGNTSIVEAISAEDIGKLPDSSIAESIARLPGLTAQRERGRATQIQIRGFAGDFAGTTLNGREQASTGDNRGAEFDQYPSELLSQVVVYKTPDASLIGQGLSGTVDLQTVDPLSYSDRVVSFNYRYDQNELNGDTENGNRFSFAYIDQFLDNTLGISVGYAYMDSPQPGLQNEAWGYADGPDGTKVYGGGKLYKFDSEFERNGWAGTIQYRPNEFYETSLDIFYSTFDKTEIKSGLEVGTAWGGATLLPGYTVGGNSTITDSDWANTKPVIRMDSNPINDTVQSYGWNNIFTFNDDWKMIVDLSTSEANRKFTVLETYAGLIANGGFSDLNVSLNNSSYNDLTFASDLGNPANLQLIDAGNWGQDGYLKNFEVEDKLDSYRVDFVRSFADGGISSLEFGFNYTDRSKTKSSDEYFLCINADVQNGCGRGYATAPFPGSEQSFGFGGLDSLATYDAEALVKSGFYTLKSNGNEDIAQKNWSVEEQMTTLYLQANIDTSFGDVPVRGNIGVQYVGVDQSSVAYAAYDGVTSSTPVKGGASYSNLLPSLNLSFGLFEDQFLRVATAKQMARPRMDAMRASYNVSNNQTNCSGVPGPVWCGDGGNPELRPWLANAFDASYEWYFTTEEGNKGYLSAAYFYKDLESYVYYAKQPFNYADDPLPPPEPGDIVGVTYPDSTVGVLDQPINGQGGTMQGYELTASLPLDLIWGALDGFGLQATYSVNDSNIEPTPGSSQPIPGLSKYTSNTTLYYENYGWSVRYSYRTRSEFRGETRGFGADLVEQDFNAEKVQDAQINYTFGSGMLENLTLYLQVSNIGDEPVGSNQGENRPINYFEYGRQTLAGFSYKF
ncbi:MAG TPA: TonB-dependent receptor [Arenimonas sp.]|nr:TonB-dependent receptor [Arenimonas sp.]